MSRLAALPRRDISRYDGEAVVRVLAGRVLLVLNDRIVRGLVPDECGQDGKQEKEGKEKPPPQHGTRAPIKISIDEEGVAFLLVTDPERWSHSIVRGSAR